MTESDDHDQESLDPAAVVRRVHELRVTRQWFELEVFIVPEQRRAIRDLIVATDALLEANKRLTRAIVETHGLAAAIPFDRSQAGNALGVFSIDVTVLGQRIDGDSATVVLQVAGRVPVQEVASTRQGGRWLITTDPPIDELPRQIGRLADRTNETAARLERGELSMDELTTLLDIEQTPILRRIARLTSGDS